MTWLATRTRDLECLWIYEALLPRASALIVKSSLFELIFDEYGDIAGDLA